VTFQDRFEFPFGFSWFALLEGGRGFIESELRGRLLGEGPDTGKQQEYSRQS